MNTSRRFRTVLAGAALASSMLWLGGCASSVKLDPAPVENRTPTPASSAASGAGSASSTVTPVDLTQNGQGDASKLDRVVYFDFDSYVVKDEFHPLLESHAKALKAAAQKKLAVEGHTDERGGREYNLALGQKRAEAVVKSLEVLGVPGAQLEAVSFGKERPAVEGNDEAAWAKNRRAELRYR